MNAFLSHGLAAWHYPGQTTNAKLSLYDRFSIADGYLNLDREEQNSSKKFLPPCKAFQSLTRPQS